MHIYKITGFRPNYDQTAEATITWRGAYALMH